jgi:hypothetical protein
MSTWTYDDIGPGDRMLCHRYGAGAVPCGPPVKIRVSRQSRGPRHGEHPVRRPLCQMHYDASVTGTDLSQIKALAVKKASEALIHEHRDEFNGYFETTLGNLIDELRQAAEQARAS